MKQASKYVNMNYDAVEEIDFDESDDILTQVSANNEVFSLQSAPARSRNRRTSSRKKRKTKFRKATTNVVAIQLGTLTDDVVVATGDPEFCSKCSAAFAKPDLKKLGLVHSETQEESEGNEKEEQEEKESTTTTTTTSSMDDEEEDDDVINWTCSFCQTVNKVYLDKEEYPTDDTVDYILAPPDTTVNSDETDTKTLIFCIDVSGSMCVTTEIQGKFTLKGDRLKQNNSLDTQGVDQFRAFGAAKDVTYVSRLQAVQAAVDSQLVAMQKEHPNRKVGLITFNGDVTIYGDGTSSPTVISGDKLTDFDALIHQAQELQTKCMTKSIKDSKDDLSKQLFSLTETGCTALGPALVTAVGMASSSRGSEVVICTDGLANIGIGSMDELKTEDEESQVEAIYRRIGMYAKEKGVTVNVISIEGTDCSVENLGIVTDISGGDVTIVDPLKITSEFKEILALPVIATNVSVKLLLHKLMYVRSYDDVDEKEVEKNNNIFVKDVGNVTSESAFTVEYSVRKRSELKDEDGTKDLKTLPFQLQIRYTKLNGMKCIRIINQEQKTTWDEQKAEQEADLDVLGMNAVQTTAKIAKAGDYTAARFQNFTYMDLLSRAAGQEEDKIETLGDWASAAQDLESALQTEQIQELDEGLTLDMNTTKASRSKTRKQRRAKKDTTAKTLYSYTQHKKKMKKKRK